MMDDDETWRKLNELPPPRDLADVVERLVSVLLWLDANGHVWASVDINQALEKLVPDKVDPQPGRQ